MADSTNIAAALADGTHAAARAWRACDAATRAVRIVADLTSATAIWQRNLVATAAARDGECGARLLATEAHLDEKAGGCVQDKRHLPRNAEEGTALKR